MKLLHVWSCRFVIITLSYSVNLFIVLLFQSLLMHWRVQKRVIVVSGLKSCLSITKSEDYEKTKHHKSGRNIKGLTNCEKWPKSLYLKLSLSDTVRGKPEPKKEKGTKPQSKPQLKASPKKTSNRRSPLKKEKNCVVDASPPEPAENQVVAPSAEETGGSEEPPLGSSCSPAHKVFQRTLSPADVLHVHSYAKGDYGEGEVLPKEEKRSEESDHETETDNSYDGKAVSGHARYTVSYRFIDHSCGFCTLSCHSKLCNLCNASHSMTRLFTGLIKHQLI